ncbi:MAG: hypothetical protein QXE92_00130 [Thermofilaceae archaeon]
MVYVPPDAEDETVMVIVEDAEDPDETETGFGLNETVTPEGAPLAERVMLCDEPEPLVEVRVTVAVVVVEPLSGILTVPLEGLTDTEKSFTYNVRVAVLVTPPPDPVIVTVNVPSEAEEEAVRVSVLVKVGVPLDGLKLAVTPDGKPEAERLTVSEPLTAVTVTVAVLLAPLHSDRLEGLTDIEKSNGELIVSVYDAVLLEPQLLEAVIVIVYVPVGAVELTVIVIVDVADEPGLTVTLLGLKLTETPEGAPEAERLIVCDEPEPLADVTVTVAVVEVLPLVGLVTEPLEGLTDTEKSFT